MELVLGVVGTIAGIVSLALHLKRFLREKPILRVEVEKFGHFTSDNNTKMSIEFLVRNIGHRGTTLNGIRWWVRSFKPEYHEISTRKSLHKQVKAYDSQRLSCELDLDFKIDELLNTVKFELYHTRDVEKFQATSVLRPSRGTIHLGTTELMNAIAIDQKRWQLHFDSLN